MRNDPYPDPYPGEMWLQDGTVIPAATLKQLTDWEIQQFVIAAQNGELQKPGFKLPPEPQHFGDGTWNEWL